MSELEIFETQDGSHSVLSHQFGVSYHSKYGAVQETRHVFVEAGLFQQALTKSDLHILDVGFGTGLNAYLTLLEAQKRNLSIRYDAIEKFPMPEEQVKQLNYADQIQASEEEKNWFESLHQSSWGDWYTVTPGFELRKHKLDIQSVDFENQFDLIYYDAFAPTAQPELWEEPVMERMQRALVPGGVLVTYCAKGAFKRTLKGLGFEVETLQGPPGKREMTRAIRV